MCMRTGSFAVHTATLLDDRVCGRHIMRILLFLLCMALSQAFYLPGVIPQEYVETENITVKVNSLKSIETAVPYDYYSIMVCRPPKQPVAEAENIGEILWGDSIKPSAYKMQMKQEVVDCVWRECLWLGVHKPLKQSAVLAVVLFSQGILFATAASLLWELWDHQARLLHGNGELCCPVGCVPIVGWAPALWEELGSGTYSVVLLAQPLCSSVRGHVNACQVRPLGVLAVSSLVRCTRRLC